MRGKDDQSAGRARRLRRASANPEFLLWKRLRNRQLDGYKFVRQEAIAGILPILSAVNAVSSSSSMG